MINHMSILNHLQVSTIMPYFNQQNKVIIQNHSINKPVLTSSSLYAGVGGRGYLFYTLEGVTDNSTNISLSVSPISSQTFQPTFSKVDVYCRETWVSNGTTYTEVSVLTFTDLDYIEIDVRNTHTETVYESTYTFYCIYEDTEGRRSAASNTIKVDVYRYSPSIFTRGHVPRYDATLWYDLVFIVVDGPAYIPEVFRPTYTIETSVNGSEWLPVSNNEVSEFDNSGVTLVNLGYVSGNNFDYIRMTIQYPKGIVYEFNLDVAYSTPEYY